MKSDINQQSLSRKALLFHVINPDSIQGVAHLLRNQLGSLAHFTGVTIDPVKSMAVAEAADTDTIHNMPFPITADTLGQATK